MNQYVDIIEPEFIEIHNICQPFIITSTDRLYSLYNAVRYTILANLQGDFSALDRKYLLQRIDYTGRSLVKA